MPNPKIFPDRNAQCRDWRLRRRYQGLCVNCGLPAARNWHGKLLAHCRRCLDRRNELQKARKQEAANA